MIAVNQTGVWLGMKAAVPAMREAGGGAIVNISSLYGLIGSPGSITYHATKGAVRLMTKSAALEYVKEGIRVNSIHPGQIDTPILSGLTPEQNEQIRAATPMGRLGRPEEIAYGSLYLCSDEACLYHRCGTGDRRRLVCPVERTAMNRQSQIQLTPEEQEAYLAEARTMTLCTIDKNGYPHAVAMAYMVKDGCIYMTSFRKAQKVVNARRNPKVTVMIESGTG